MVQLLVAISHHLSKSAYSLTQLVRYLLPLEGIYSQIFLVYKMNKVLAAAVFITGKDGKITKCPSMKGQLNTLLYIHTMEYHAAIKKN